jgi:hypothetical protein
MRGEELTQSCVLVVVEIAPTRRCDRLALPANLVVVEIEAGCPVNQLKIEGPTGGNDGADLERPSEQVKRTLRASDLWPTCIELPRWHEELGRGPIAPRPHIRTARKKALKSGRPLRPKPDVRELVCEREHLGRLGVRPVHEDQGRIRIAQRKAAELLNVEGTVGIVSDGTIDHCHDTQLLDSAS